MSNDPKKAERIFKAAGFKYGTRKNIIQATDTGIYETNCLNATIVNSGNFDIVVDGIFPMAPGDQIIYSDSFPGYLSAPIRIEFKEQNAGSVSRSEAPNQRAFIFLSEVNSIL